MLAGVGKFCLDGCFESRSGLTGPGLFFGWCMEHPLELGPHSCAANKIDHGRSAARWRTWRALSGCGQCRESLPDVSYAKPRRLGRHLDRSWPNATSLGAAPNRLSTTGEDCSNHLVVDKRVIWQNVKGSDYSWHWLALLLGLHGVIPAK